MKKILFLFLIMASLSFSKTKPVESSDQTQGKGGAALGCIIGGIGGGYVGGIGGAGAGCTIGGYIGDYIGDLFGIKDPKTKIALLERKMMLDELNKNLKKDLEKEIKNNIGD